MLINVVLLVVLFIIVGMLWTEGMWTNAISMVNVIFAGIAASNLFEPTAEWLEDQMSSYTYVMDFLAFWLVFAVIYNVLRAVTDQISKHKVRFKKPIEIGGNAIFALATAWVMVCIVSFSLHLAPLSLSPFRGSFATEPTARIFFGLAPDHMWLGFLNSRSQKGLSRKSPKAFDATGDFIPKYGARRRDLQKINLDGDGTVRVKGRR